MPIRPIDPAKRGLPPVVSFAASQKAAADPTPGHQPQPAIEASSSSPDAIMTPARARPPALTTQPGGTRGVDHRDRERTRRAHHIVDRSGPNWEGGNYIVGKGRPPKATQWQKGQSGNPRGPKPQEKLDPQAAFEKEIMTEFIAKVNGAEVKLNMGTFVVQLLKASAAKGTVKAQQMLLDLFMTTLRKSVGREDTPEMEVWEQQVVDQMLKEYGLPAQPVFRKTDRTVDEEGEA